MKTLALLLILFAGAAAPAATPEMPAAQSGGQEKEAAKTQEEAPFTPDITPESMKKLYQPYLANLESYEPMYFLAGADPKHSKFQVSLKHRLLGEDGSVAKRFPWATGFHFGYTQTSFWDLRSESKPFEDTSYKPELLFLSPNIETGIPHAKAFFVQSGLQHESNGRDGISSRSTNFAYIRPMCVFYDEASRLGLLVAPKVWIYVANDKETNPDLSDYRGYFDLELKLGKADGLMLGSHLRWATEGTSAQWDLTYPLHRILARNLDVYLNVQYVDGLAESLIHYQERTQALRVGFALVR